MARRDSIYSANKRIKGRPTKKWSHAVCGCRLVEKKKRILKADLLDCGIYANAVVKSDRKCPAGCALKTVGHFWARDGETIGGRLLKFSCSLGGMQAGERESSVSGRGAEQQTTSREHSERCDRTTDDPRHPDEEGTWR